MFKSSHPPIANVLHVLLILLLGAGCTSISTTPAESEPAPSAETSTDSAASPAAPIVDNAADAIDEPNIVLESEALSFAGNGDTFLEQIEEEKGALADLTHHRYIEVTDPAGSVWQGELLIHNQGTVTFLQPLQGGSATGVRLETPGEASGSGLQSLLTAIAAQLPSATQTAAPPDVTIQFVRARQSDDGVWAFDVTLDHPDTGWEDYTDGWHVATPDGEILGTRILLHPHETEMPFTRSLSGVQIPAEVDAVVIRAHDLVSGYDAAVLTVPLDQPSAGERYEVTR